MAPSKWGISKTHGGSSLRAASNDVLADGSRVTVLDRGYENVSVNILDDYFTCTSRLTKDVQLIDETGLSTRRVGVTQETVEEATSQKVTENTIGLGLLCRVAAGDVTNIALRLGVVKGSRV